MAKHNTYIYSEDARAQAEFYTNALGGEIVSLMTYGELPEAKEELKDKIIHLCFTAAGVSFMMSDCVAEPLRHGNSISQALEFDTEEGAHEAFNRLSEGGQVKHPLTPAFWGALYGEIEDKYSVNWMITTSSNTCPS